MFYSEATERLVLGLSLIDNTILPMLENYYFYMERNKKIYRKMCSLLEAGKQIDLISLAEAFKDDPAINTISLSALVEGVPKSSVENIGTHVATLKELYKKRQLDIQAMTIREALKQGDMERLEKAVENIRKNGDLGEEANALNVGDLILGYDKFKALGGGVHLGIPSFDGEADGLAGGEVMYLLARAKVIKSVFAQNVLRNFTMKHAGDGAIFFSLEMNPPQLGERLLQIESGKSILDNVTDQDREEIVDRHQNIFYITKAAISLSDIHSTIVSLKYKSNIRLVIIDFLTRIKTHMQGEYDFLRHATTFLKDMAKELNIALLVLAQVGREWGGDGSTPLSLRSARGSGTIEEDADFIFGAYRPELANNITPQRLDIVKDRVVLQCLGARRIRKLRDIWLYFDKQTLRLKEVSRLK